MEEVDRFENKNIDKNQVLPLFMGQEIVSLCILDLLAA